MALLNSLTSTNQTQVGAVYVMMYNVSVVHHAGALVRNGSRETYRHMESYGSVLVWDAAMPQLKPLMDRYRDRQTPYK